MNNRDNDNDNELVNHNRTVLAMVTGLFGAVLGSTHPIAAVLVCAFAGALTSGSIITFCIATLPNHIFGVSIFFMTDIFFRAFLVIY